MHLFEGSESLGKLARMPRRVYNYNAYTSLYNKFEVSKDSANLPSMENRSY